VVAAAFDEDSERAIDAVRRSLVVDGRGRRRPSVRPHLTLSAARVEDVGEVAGVAEQVAARHRAFPLVLGEFGTFDRVIWLGPRRTRALTRVHRDTWDSLIAAGWPPAFAGQSERGRLLQTPTAEPVQARVTELVTIVVGAGEKARASLRER
jgi:2'-5' RNA ligase